MLVFGGVLFTIPFITQGFEKNRLFNWRVAAFIAPTYDYYFFGLVTRNNSMIKKIRNPLKDIHDINTLQGTNIAPEKPMVKMIFLFPRWDMLVP